MRSSIPAAPRIKPVNPERQVEGQVGPGGVAPRRRGRWAHDERPRDVVQVPERSGAGRRRRLEHQVIRAVRRSRARPAGRGQTGDAPEDVAERPAQGRAEIGGQPEGFHGAQSDAVTRERDLVREPEPRLGFRTPRRSAVPLRLIRRPPVSPPRGLDLF